MGTKLICTFKAKADEVKAPRETKLWAKMIYMLLIVLLVRESNKIVEWKIKLDFLAFIVVVKSVGNL